MQDGNFCKADLQKLPQGFPLLSGAYWPAWKELCPSVLGLGVPVEFLHSYFANLNRETDRLTVFLKIGA